MVHNYLQSSALIESTKIAILFMILIQLVVRRRSRAFIPYGLPSIPNFFPTMSLVSVVLRHPNANRSQSLIYLSATLLLLLISKDRCSRPNEVLISDFQQNFNYFCGDHHKPSHNSPPNSSIIILQLRSVRTPIISQPPNQIKAQNLY